MGSGCSADNGGGSSHRMLEESGTVALRLAPPNLARKVSKLSLNDRRESGRPVSSPLRSDSSGEDASRKHSPSRRAVTTVPMLMVQQPGDGQRSRPVSPGRVKRDESPNTLTDRNATMGPTALSGRPSGRSPATSHQSLVAVPTSERADPWLDRAPLDAYEDECQ